MKMQKTILLALVGLSGVLLAETLDPLQFQSRSRLVVKGYTGTSTLADFPVLVRLGENRPSGFTYAAAGEDGAGLRFSDAEGNLIPHEVDTWNASGESLVWVKLPELPANGTSFWVNWSPVAGATLPEVTASEVWSKYVVVMHGNEFADSSPSQLTVANGGAVTAGSTDALVGKSYHKTNNDAVGLNFTNPWTAGKFTANGKMTVTGWVKLVDSGYTHVWFSSVYGFGDPGSISYWGRGVSNVGGSLEVNTSGTMAKYGSFTILPYKAWNHVAVVHDGAATSLYRNGDCVVSATGNALGDTGQTYWTFGSYANKKSLDSFKGVMDELRIYDGTASADWIKAEYDAAHNPGFVEEFVEETGLAGSAILAVKGGYTGTSTLTDFPVLVRLEKGRPSGFSYVAAGENGAGLRFFDAEGNRLPHEIDTWNPAGESLVWVKLPSLSAAGTTFEVRWSPEAEAAQPEVAASEVWTKYVAVMHGNEFADSSPSQLSVANGGTVVAGSADAMLGKSYHKTNNDAVGLNFTNPWTAGKFTANGKMTVTGWVKLVDSGYTHVWFSSVYGFGDPGSISYWGRGVSNVGGSLEVNTSGTIAKYGSLTILPYNAWNHVAVVHDGAATSLYRNGDCVASATGNALGDTGQTYWTFGSYANKKSLDSFKGVMDELRIYDGTASADWIKAEYDAAHNVNFVEEIIDETKFAHSAILAVLDYQGDSTLEEFPVLVRLKENFPATFVYADAGTDGAGLRFADMEGHPLAFEVDMWNPSGESLVWVRLPALSPALTTFKMCWGAPDLQSLPVPTPSRTWSKYVAVMHGNAFADASPNRLVVVNGGAVVAGDADAFVGKSYHKTNNDAVGLNFTNPWTAGKFTANGKMTVTGWVKLVDSGYTHVWFSSVCGFGDPGSISYWGRGVSNVGGSLEVNTSGTMAKYGSFTILPYNAWNHVAVVHDGAATSLYRNGDCVASATGNALGDTGQTYWTFGSYANKKSLDSFKGVMDELRIYDGTASADWIKAEYDSAHNPGFVVELDESAVITAIWKGTGAAGVLTDPANWDCYNVFGEQIAGALPHVNVTTVFIRGDVPEFSIADAAACCGRRFLVEDATLLGDCDWAGIADRLEFVGTLDLNGHTLTVADLPGAGTITGSGTLRVTTAGTATIGTALTGALSLVKAGTGTLVSARADQSYTGGTTVEAGILRFATASTPAGALTGKITIKDGGAVDLYANAGLAYPYELEGNGPAGRGALFTSLDQNSWYTTWMGDVALTGDASFGSGIVCNGRTLTLNQHVLSLNADHTYKVTNSKEVLFQNARVADEGVIRVPAGRLSSLANGSSAANTTFTGDKVTLEFAGTGSMVGLLIRGGFKVKNLTYSSGWLHVSDNLAKVVVDGCYSPNSTNLPPVMLTGSEAVLDLSTQTNAFDTATGLGLAFADNAVVTLSLGDRETEDGEQLVSWIKPENFDKLKFKLEKKLTDDQYRLHIKDEGIFIYRSGLIIMVR